LVRAAQAYIERHEVTKETRFDVVSVVLTSTSKRVHLIRDAFYPVL